MNIRDVAREARVGVGTVSRVLNGSSELSSKTRAHIEAVIRRLGYRPHAQARRILRKSGMVCFLLANRPFLHSFHAAILEGVEARANELKQHVVFLRMQCDMKTPPEDILLPPILGERGWVDGVILTGAVYPNLIQRIQGLNLPIVAFGNNIFEGRGRARFDRVRYDGLKGQFDATEYLLNKGHQLVAFVGNVSYPWFREQHQGYLRAMRARDLHPISIARDGPSDFVEYGEWAVPRLLKRKPRPTAVLAGSDEVAYGLLRQLRIQGVKVPGDVSLMGFDDRELAALMEPPLTTVHVYTQRIGQCCMQVLSERLRQPSQPHAAHIVPTSLVERASVESLNPAQDIPAVNQPKP